MVDSTALQILVPIGSAVLGFVSSYSLERIRRRREPTHRISWEATTERAVIDAPPDVRSGIAISYNGSPVVDLAAVTCRISNTGNRVVKHQFVRFEFSPGSQILSSRLDPAPPRELSAVRVGDREIGSWEAVYEIGHFEKGQDVTVKILASGRNLEDWKIYSFNDAGDVEFQRRDVSRRRQDEEHVIPFFSYLIAMLVFASVFAPIAGVEFGGYLLGFCELILAILVANHVIPAVRWLRDTIANRSSRSGMNNMIQGGRYGYVYQFGDVAGHVTLAAPSKPDEDGEEGEGEEEEELA